MRSAESELRRVQFHIKFFAACEESFAHFLEGNVERFFLPGSNSLNFILHDVLGGGGPASLRNDPQGKAYAQILLDQLIPVPKNLVE